MKKIEHTITSKEIQTVRDIEEKARESVAQIEYDRAEAEVAEQRLEEEELRAELEAAQREEAEREAQEHERNIERIAGE